MPSYRARSQLYYPAELCGSKSSPQSARAPESKMTARKLFLCLNRTCLFPGPFAHCDQFHCHQFFFFTFFTLQCSYQQDHQAAVPYLLTALQLTFTLYPLWDVYMFPLRNRSMLATFCIAIQLCPRKQVVLARKAKPHCRTPHKGMCLYLSLGYRRRRARPNRCFVPVSGGPMVVRPSDRNTRPGRHV